MQSDNTPESDFEPSQDQNHLQILPPPAGDSEKAEKYLGQLMDLINQGKIKVNHTDLEKFDVTSIQDHYRMDLGEYEVEVNHSKEPESGQDFYVLLFNNLKRIEEGKESCVNKVILAYTHLTQTQFLEFKKTADAALEKIRQEEQRKRFSEATAPIDKVLSSIASSIPTEEKSDEEESDLAIPEDSKPKISQSLTEEDQTAI